MNNIAFRERYLGVCHFKRPGDLLMMGPHAFWPETLQAWVKQGAPKEIVDYRFRYEFFKYDPYIRPLYEIESGQGIHMGSVHDMGRGIKFGDWAPQPIIPRFTPTIIEEDKTAVIVSDGGGRKLKRLKSDQTMPMFLDFPVKDRATWKEYKKRLDPSTPERFPADWTDYVKKINERAKELPVSLEVGSFFGFLREWTGLEPLLYMFYDDPGLVEDMMDTMLHLETEIVKRVVKDIKIDVASYWEDMCYRAGPLLSPKLFRKFMMPRYQKLNDLLHSHGVDIIWLDSDGNVGELVPLWLECGVNMLWPLEVAAGNDAVALRKKYGKRLILHGNMDKRAVARGKDAIREEVMSKVPFLIKEGGFIPGIDHSLPPDASFENYCYYINTLREVGGLAKLSFK